ncbi:hypothetical protein V8C37DRAFT_379376 [Trichoderma ceciliae]
MLVGRSSDASKVGIYSLAFALTLSIIFPFSFASVFALSIIFPFSFSFAFTIVLAFAFALAIIFSFAFALSIILSIILSLSLALALSLAMVLAFTLFLSCIRSNHFIISFTADSQLILESIRLYTLKAFCCNITRIYFEIATTDRCCQSATSTGGNQESE